MKLQNLARVVQGNYEFRLSRRQALKAAAASTSAGALAAQGRAFQATAKQDISGELVFRTWGGAMTEVLEETWAKPFEEEYGVRVIMDTGELPEVQIQQQQGNPQFDVVSLNRFTVYEIAPTGVLQELDASVIPNLENVYPVLLNEESTSVPAYFGEMGLVFNTDHVAPDPTSWEALWNDDYAGHVVTPTAVDGSGIFITAIAEMVGTSWDGDLEPVWDKLEELRPNVLTQYASAGQMVNLLQTEAAWIGPWYNGRAWTAIDQGLPLGYVTPDEGAMIVLIDLVIPQGAPNIDAAYAFVNFALEERQQAAFAERFSYAPAREGVELSEEAARKVPYGEEGVERLIVPDWEEFIALTDAWAERWLQIFGAPED